jgi:GH25 family lysozyme M1 (1,4-beta-N-acetylmuramidase)
MTEPGIDVSYAQGKFNWTAEHGKVAFAAAKATEGLNTTDPQFGANWNGMWAISRTLPRFAYHFFHAAENPEDQAAHLVSTVKPHGLLAGDNLLLDLEATASDGRNDGMAPATVAARAKVCLDTINTLAPNHRVLVYTPPSFAEAGNCAGLDPWSLWIANYGVSKPTVPKPWKTWTFWQSSGTTLDQDRYNGTEAQLLAFTRMPKSR